MKISEFELQDVASTFKQESLANLKAIQRVMCKEINSRMNTLDCCAQDQPVPIQKGCNKMNTANSMSIVAAYPQETVEERRISFMISQLSDAGDRKRVELKRHFGLLDDEKPRNPKDLIERIEKGLYVIPEHITDDGLYYNVLEYMEWRNPKVKKDQEGCSKAIKEMEADFREANRTIVLKDAEKGLAALEKFEKAKFH